MDIIYFNFLISFLTGNNFLSYYLVLFFSEYYSITTLAFAYILFFQRLSLFSIIILSLPIFLQIYYFIFSLELINILFYIYYQVSIAHWPVDEQLGGFYFHTVVNRTTIRIGIEFTGYMSRSGLAGPKTIHFLFVEESPNQCQWWLY